MFKTALISVSDKTGLVDFLRPFASGLTIVSTGGSAQHLRDAGFSVIDVAEWTGHPEVMGGRVKTLHPRVHMSLLARPDQPADMELLRSNHLSPFDLVVINLYPFAQAARANASYSELVEKIDIGGPTMLRAAAKNSAAVTVVCDPADYAYVQNLSLQNKWGDAERRKLMAKAFSHTAYYDSLIAEKLLQQLPSEPETPPEQSVAPSLLFSQNSWAGHHVHPLRYGENPQQLARWWARGLASDGLHRAEVLMGKALSYNNLLDLDAAWRLARELKGKAAVAVKHNNPCGVAQGLASEEVIARCLAADPVSVFGGVVAINHELDLEGAKLLSAVFLECVIAPEVSEAARQCLAAKKNLRVLRWPSWGKDLQEREIRSLAGGILEQDPMIWESWSDSLPASWQCLGSKPSVQNLQDLQMAQRIAGSLKSNAIAIVGNAQSVGLGMGQVNRVDAVAQALVRMREYATRSPGFRAEDCVLASDAFFPFPDSVEKIHASGIRWVLQPGGSMRDDQVLARARDLGVNMVVTKVRHFRH